jgi:hypothetical protein
MTPTDRFADRWREWDSRVHERADATAFLKTATDETLIELLAGNSDRDRKYERDIIATEIQNRLAKRATDHPEGADEVFRAAYAAYEEAARGQRAMHTAENILKTHGDVELGNAVSLAANLSLDATRLAMKAAQQHAIDLQAARAQSRIAARLAEDAEQIAEEAQAKAERAAARVAELGHAAEAQAAREAAARLHDAAATAAKKLRDPTTKDR